jgi:hypothetical protein
MAKDKRQAFAGPQSGQPIPGEHALDGDHDSVTIGSHGPKLICIIETPVFEFVA